MTARLIAEGIMLKNLSIRHKIALVLLGPLLILLIVSGLSMWSSLGDSGEASDAENLTEMSSANADLFDALRTEAVLDQLAIDNEAIDSGEDEAATDSVVARWLGLAGRFSDADTDGLIGAIAELDAHRAAAGSTDHAVAHRTNMDLLANLAAFDARINAGAGEVAAGELSRAATLTNIELLAVDGQLLGLWASAEGVVPDRDLAITLGAAESLAEAYNAAAPAGLEIADQTADYAAAVEDFIAAVPGQLTTVSTSEWLSASQDRSDAIDGAHTSVLANARAIAADASASASSQMRNTGILFLVGLLLGVGVALWLASQLASGLRSVTDEATAIAESDLPELAAALGSGEAQSTLADRPLVAAEGTDELAQLRQSLNRIRESADSVGQQQTQQLRSGISEMFVNLARRNQTLVDRQLQVIDELEAEERDPDRLSQLYRVDHLATRMRRNAESLLVLAGHNSSRRRGAPVELREVIRVAIGEVEDYRRIIPIALDEIPVAAHVAQDLAHLLSELMENATQSSPPGTVADVIGVADADGSYTIQVIDRGTGIDDDQRHDLNAALSAPPTNTLVVSKTMGLTVVGRLAARIGVNVSLNVGSDGGTIATVDIPTEVVADWRGDKPESLTQQAIRTVPGQFAKPAPAGIPTDVDTGAPAVEDETAAFVFDGGVQPTDTHSIEAEDNGFTGEPVDAETPALDLFGNPVTDPVDESSEPVESEPTVSESSNDEQSVFEPVFDGLDSESGDDATPVFEDLGLPIFDLPSLGVDAMDPLDVVEPEEPLSAPEAPTVTPPPIPSMSAPILEPAPEAFDPPSAISEEPQVAPEPGSSEGPMDFPVDAPTEVHATAPFEVHATAPFGAVTEAPIVAEAETPLFQNPEFTTPVIDAVSSSGEDASANSEPVLDDPPASQPLTTPSGLIKRQRKPQMSESQAAFDRTPATTPSKRSPDQVKSMLSRYKSGLERGRSDGES